MTGLPVHTDLDHVDRQLLRVLQADGRTSYAAMAAQVNLSAPAVRLRLQRLADAGVLQVVAVTDPIALGYPVMAMVAVTTSGDTRPVADAISAIDHVIYLVLTSGAQDMLVEVVCRSADELFTVVNDRIRSVPGVVGTTVSPYYGIHTHRFTWGVPAAATPVGTPTVSRAGRGRRASQPREAARGARSRAGGSLP